MNNSTFEVGSTVYLKSGGPRMTVIDVKDGPLYREVHLAWFSNGDLKTAQMVSDALTDVNPAVPPKPARPPAIPPAPTKESLFGLLRGNLG